MTHALVEVKKNIKNAVASNRLFIFISIFRAEITSYEEYSAVVL